MTTDTIERARLDAKLAAKAAFVARWNAAREARIMAYMNADAAWQIALDAGLDHNAAIAFRRQALHTAEAIEDAELDAAGAEYSSACAAAEAIGRP